MDLGSLGLSSSRLISRHLRNYYLIGFEKCHGPPGICLELTLSKMPSELACTHCGVRNFAMHQRQDNGTDYLEEVCLLF